MSSTYSTINLVASPSPSETSFVSFHTFTISITLKIYEILEKPSLDVMVVKTLQ